MIEILPNSYKESKIAFKPETLALTDTGYQGIKKLHTNSDHLKKKSKKNPLNHLEKLNNKAISSECALNEHVIGMIKRFKIVADRYRNRRKRFGLRFNLIAEIYNYELCF